MKYNYYDSNKIVIHGKAVPGQTLAWGETKMLTADKIQSVNTTDYWGNVLYENSRPTTVLSNGRYILLNQDSTLTWCSVEKDHLGSNRVVREETSGINRLQINHYYPFGNTFGEYNHCDENTDLQRYKFNSKELDLVHGLRLYDYGARMYDQILGCWTSVTQWLRNIIISARMCSVWTILYEWWIEMERIHGIFSQQQMQQPLTSDISIMIILYEKTENIFLTYFGFVMHKEK